MRDRCWHHPSGTLLDLETIRLALPSPRSHSAIFLPAATSSWPAQVPPSNAPGRSLRSQMHRRRLAPRHDQTMSGNMHKQAGDVVRLRCTTRTHDHRSALRPARPTCAGSIPNREQGTKQRTILQIKRRGRGSLHAAGDHITRLAGVPPR
ncbi:hypothetical protein DAEQUDRAFT_216289 [Daedalea quercina L-15889]|uniref:Uncharacterized protein n=1 Tax=Daedalea quercina L-15889 TaxID=1314783 RepID=A0A165R4E3_9APHY|nr:hypothetical protein DAEQUDRAFT_216289 [Daedalea quercina L-15889]